MTVDVTKFGYKDPKKNEIDGFEIDIAREIAKKIFGDETKVDLVAACAFLIRQRAKLEGVADRFDIQVEPGAIVEKHLLEVQRCLLEGGQRSLQLLIGEGHERLVVAQFFMRLEIGPATPTPDEPQAQKELRYDNPIVPFPDQQ